MPRHFKSKTLRRSKRRYRGKTKRNHIKRKHYGSFRYKIGGRVDVDIPSIKIAGNGGSDSNSALERINHNTNIQANLNRALTGGSGGTYTVPTFINGGDPHSDVANANSVSRALVGALVQSQVDSEFDKNAIKQSGGKYKFKANKKNKHKYSNSKKSRKRRH